jgi:hypothetical protein
MGSRAGNGRSERHVERINRGCCHEISFEEHDKLRPGNLLGGRQRQKEGQEEAWDHGN